MSGVPPLSQPQLQVVSPTTQRPDQTPPDPDDQRPPKRRRQRAALSCDQCRKRKCKCDREEPCGQCVKAKFLQCSYTPLAGSNNVSHSTPAYNNGQQVQFVVGPSMFGHEQAAPPQLPYHTPPYRGQLPQPAPVGFSAVGTEKAPGGTFSKTRLFGQSHWMHCFGRFDSIVRTMVCIRDNPILNASFFQDELAKTEISALMKKCKAMSKSSKMDLHEEWLKNPDLQNLVPPRHVAETLIDLYWQTSESIFRVLHFGSFQREYQEYWRNPLNASQVTILKMLLVMANAACFYQEGDADHVRAQAKKWIFAGQQWIFNLPTQKSRLDISGIQIHCLLILARQADGIVGDLAWVSMGNLYRSAIIMGMHRDPRFIPKMTPLHAELRRRLWATILEIDLQLSLDMGMKPTISPEDYDTEPPLNINDDQLMDDTQNVVATGQFTQTTLQRILLESYPLRLRVCRLLNDFRGPPSYDLVLNLDSQLKAACKNAQVQVKESATSTTQLQRNLLDISIRRFLFLLHIDFGAKAIEDKKFYFSRTACLDCAVHLATYPSNEAGTHALSLSNPHPDLYTLLKVRAQFFFKRVMLQACMIILDELFQQLNEESDISILQREQALGTRKFLKNIIRETIELLEKRIPFAENNVKAHIFTCAVLGQLEALENKTDPEKGAIEGAKRSARFCLDLLAAKTARTPDSNAGVAVNGIMQQQQKGEKEGGVKALEMPTPPEQGAMFENFDALMGSWGADVEGGDGWLFAGWEDDRGW